jgi:hypothetical protein
MTPNYDDPQVHYDDPQVHYDVSTPSPIKMSSKKTTYPVNEVLGFMSGSQQMLTTKKTEMIAKGVDPTALIASLGTKHTSLNNENITQESLKTQLRNQTTVVENEKADGYDLASRACDMIISAYGRTSEAAVEATNMRKSVRPAPRREPSAPATP